MWCGLRLRHWWNPAAFDRARELALGYPRRQPTITMFYAEIGVLAERIGAAFSADRDSLPPLPADWKKLPNTAVLTALRAERKLASGQQEDIDAGLALLRAAIADTERRLDDAGNSSAEHHPRPAEGATGANHAKHRNTYYRIVLALLHVRLGRALAALGGHEREAEHAFGAARREQPVVLSYVNQEAARFLLSRGRDGEADTALRATRSMKTMTAQIELAVARAATASASLDYASRQGEQRNLLPRLQEIADDLACIIASNNPAAVRQRADLQVWHGKALADQARVLAELGEHARAARMFQTSAAAYSADEKFLASAMVLGELRGDEEVKLGVSPAGYLWGLERWRNASQPARQRDQAMQLTGKLALATLLEPATPSQSPAAPLARYAAQFADHPGGACVALATQPEGDPLLGNPAIAQRLRLVFDAMLRGPAAMHDTRDRALALLTLFARDVPDHDFPAGGPGESIIRPWLQGIRLELDIGLVGPTADISAALIGRARRAREGLQEAWGLQLPGIRMSDSAFGARGYSISLAGNIVDTGVIPAAGATPATAAPAAHPRRRKRRPAPPPLPQTLPPETLAPDAERVFQHLEETVARRLAMVVGHGHLTWLLDHYGQRDDAGGTSIEEQTSAASMTALLSMVRSLLGQRIKLSGFPDFYRRLRAGLAAGQSWNAVVEDIRHLPEVSAALWGTEPDRALFRVSAADTARMGAILASQDPASSAWLAHALQTLIAGLPENACLVVPDATLRGPVQTLAFMFRLDLPVLAAAEVRVGLLAEAILLALPASPAPPPLAQPAPAPLPALPAPPALTLRRLIEREASRRGLVRREVHAAFREAAAAVRRNEDAAYAAELALDRFGPAVVALQAGTAAFKPLEEWAASSRLDALRLAIYRPTGVLLPPLRLQLDDTLAPDAWTIGFNARTAAMPPAAAGMALEQAITMQLYGALHAFVGNRQVERLLHRLGQDNRFGADNRLLPANVLEIYRMPDLVAFLRDLVQQRRSIRSLQTIMELLLLYQGETPAQRLAIVASTLREF